MAGGSLRELQELVQLRLERTVMQGAKEWTSERAPSHRQGSRRPNILGAYRICQDSPARKCPLINLWRKAIPSDLERLGTSQSA